MQVRAVRERIEIPMEPRIEITGRKKKARAIEKVSNYAVQVRDQKEIRPVMQNKLVMVSKVRGNKYPGSTIGLATQAGTTWLEEVIQEAKTKAKEQEMWLYHPTRWGQL